MKIHKTNRGFFKGFTLVEMIISLGILSIIVAVLANIFGSIIDVQLSSEATSAVDQDARYIIAKLNYNIGKSSTITNPATPGSSTSATLTSSIDSLNYTYSLSNGNLQVASSGATLSLNSSQTSISNLTFTRIGIGDNTDTLQVKFTISSKNLINGVPQSKDFQTTFGLE